MAGNIALLLEQIIASPLKAVIDAQEESARATMEFIAGMMDRKNGKLVPRSMEVSYSQAYVDADSGDLREEKQTLSVPLVTLVPIPYISVDEVEIDFDAKIVAAKPKKEIKAVSLYAVYASRSTSSLDLSGEMHVKIKAKRADIPEGVAKLITTLSNSLSIAGEE